jgi:hypothetical protein
LNNQESLIFENNPCLSETVEIDGKELKYNVYKNRVYVSKPVDADYQSLDLYEPVEFNGEKFDTSKAPIILFNRCGGYMSHSNVIPKKFPPRKEEPISTVKIGPEPGREGKGMMPFDKALHSYLKEGMVVVFPGNRGRDYVSKEGFRLGKMPAMIVDLKAAVRYLRFNKDRIPGDTEHIISRGSSAGGGLSSLLGSTGNAPEYEEYLDEIGAAKARDDVFASVAISPVTNLEHQDEAYEWQYGHLIHNGFDNKGTQKVNQELSNILKEQFVKYMKEQNLTIPEDGTILTTDNYNDYYLHNYLLPSAAKWFGEQDDNTISIYLDDRKWINMENGRPVFKFSDYEQYLGRIKGLPAFDGFVIGSTENSAFGTPDTEGEHYTEFAAVYDPNGQNTEISSLVKKQVYLMNPVTHLKEKNGDTAQYWWVRMGAKECGFACPIVVCLVMLLENMGMDVNFRLVWDGGHCSEDDIEDQIQWIKKITEG